MFDVLRQLQPSGSKGEYYVTDAVRSLRKEGCGVSATVHVPEEDARGINSRLDLAMVNRVMQDRIQLSLMSEGVTIVDPDNTWIESDVTVGPETIVYPFSLIGAGATIGEGCRIGPFARVGVGENLGDGTTLGPVTGSGAGTP